MGKKPYTKKELQKIISQKEALIDRLKTEGVLAVIRYDAAELLSDNVMKENETVKKRIELLEKIISGIEKENKELVDRVKVDVIESDK